MFISRLDLVDYLDKLIDEIPFDSFVADFFDIESDKLLDKKIEVLEKIKKGKKTEILEEDYYSILELYSTNQIWD